MSFAYPQFLYALFSLSIPILIHLLNFRRYKKVYFTNVAMLRNIETTTRNVKQLKNWLILLARLLAITFLVMAFAQPYFPGEENNATSGESTRIVFLDNSFSMNQMLNDKSRFEAAQDVARELAQSASASTRYLLFTNNFAQSDFNVLSREEFLQEIEKLSITHHSRKQTELVSRIQAVKENTGTIEACYFISDFQKSQFNTDFQWNDSTMIPRFIQIGTKAVQNVVIDSCGLRHPIPMLNTADSLVFSISNYGENDLLEFPVRLYMNGEQRNLMTVSLAAGATSSFSMPVLFDHFGNYECHLEIRDSPVSFDDNLYFNVNIDSAIHIYQIGKALDPKYFRSLFKSPMVFRNDEQTQVDVSFLHTASMIILSVTDELSSGLVSEIIRKVDQGASLVLLPGDSSAAQTYNPLLEKLQLETLLKFDTAHHFISRVMEGNTTLRGVFEKLPDNPDLPSVNGHFKLQTKSRMLKEDVLLLENKETALRSYASGKGRVYVFSFSIQLKNSDLVRHSLFVPLFLNMAYFSQQSHPVYYTLGEDQLIRVNLETGGDQTVHLTNDNQDIIPELKRLGGKSYVKAGADLTEAGSYTLLSEDVPLEEIAFNFNRTESNPACLTAAELEQINPRGKDGISQVENTDRKALKNAATGQVGPINLWKLCVILALMFFLSEALILKFMKA